MRIGAIIREERKRRGMSQGKLASLVGIDRSTLSNIENGKTVATHDVLERLVDVLRSPRLRMELLGGAVSTFYLCNVDLHPVTVQQKAIEEMKEAIAELEKLNLINKIGPEDLTEEEQKQLLHDTLMQLQDVNICIDLIMIAMAERYHVDLRKLERLSRQKMIEKGYMKEVV